MTEKINIAEILKNCEKGMELDCTMYEDLYFDYVDELNNIHCYIQQKFNKTSVIFNQDGTPNSHTKSKCVIFPKGKTTWKGFQRPFKDGDIVATKNGQWIGITTGGKCNCFMPTYCIIKGDGEFEAYLDKKETWQFHRLATTWEKAKLFDAIKENSYKWNAETKTLEKVIQPKFKVGDRIKHKTYISQGVVVTEIKDTHYILDDESALPFTFQDEYDLVPNKFDTTTLIPFESRVLVRSSMDGLWKPAVFGFRNGYNDNAFYIVGGSCWKQCIPYMNNEHLCGTTNDCDEYYKNWE